MSSDAQNFENPAAMTRWLIGVVAKTRGISPADIGPGSAFVELGLDSMSAVSLAGDIEADLNVELSPTLLWEHPTVEELSAYLWPLWHSTAGLKKSHETEPARP